jgi:hypothetical protein
MVGYVKLADGTPVRGAALLVADPGRGSVRISDDGLVVAGGTVALRGETDHDGKYDLPEPSGNFALLVIADAGYARADRDQLMKSPDVRITPWGRIHGRMLLETKPAAGVNLQAYEVDSAEDQRPVQVAIVERATTDAQGGFVMNRVVAGSVQIERNIEQHSGANSMIFSGDVGTAQVAAGQTTTILIGGVGRPVVGRFIYPSQMDPNDYFINARANSANASDLLDVDSQRRFRVDNVLPGHYKIHIFLQKVRGDRTLQPEQMAFTMPGAPGEVSNVRLVLPDIQLR